MADRPPVLVIQFGRESYVKDDVSYSYQRDALIVNGSREWPKATGDESFLVVPGVVTAVARYVAPQTVITRYNLRADLVCAKKPGFVTPDEYARLPEGDQALYEKVTEQREQKPEPLAFRLVDGKAKPRKMPPGISPILPAHVNTYPWFWWTLPCQASRDYVFTELTKRLEALDPAQFAVTVYVNIKHIRVSMHAISIGGVSFNPNTSLLYIDRDDRDKVTPAIDGANLDEVLAKVSAWCDEKMKAILAAMAIVNCPCCGHKLPKGKTVKLVSREPRRRIGHEVSR